MIQYSSELAAQTHHMRFWHSLGLFCQKCCLPFLAIWHLDRSMLRLSIVDLQRASTAINTCQCQLKRDGEHSKGSNDRYLKSTADCETFK